MEFTYEVDGTSRIVLVRWTGPVTIAELSAHWAAMLSDRAVMECGRSLVDVRECELLLTGEELRHEVKNLLEPSLQGRGWKTAILVGKPVQFGMARQFQVFAETFCENAIFTDETAAYEWLSS